MSNHASAIFNRRRLLALLWVLLTGGFLTVSLVSYFVSRNAIRTAIIAQDLPLTSNNIFSEIQKDLVRPVLISSIMAHDTFVRDWVLQGEEDANNMTRYLKEVKDRHGAFSSFFVSEKTGRYYTADSVLKQISSSEPRDAWYYRVRDMTEDYEINVDPDLANQDLLTIFVNYRVFDYNGKLLGATGIGLTVDAVRNLIAEYQHRFNRTIYFVNLNGEKIEFGRDNGQGVDLHKEPGIGPLIDRIIAEKSGFYQFEAGGDNNILHVNYLPELKWLLFVQQNESLSLAGIRHTLYTNMAISLIVTIIVVLLIQFAFNRYQHNIEQMASTDKLTGLLNRHAFTILIDKLIAEYQRSPNPISMLIIDIDHFKQVNDRHGHLVGDDVLASVSASLLQGVRKSDLVVRWGGEEFLIVLKRSNLSEAERFAEKLRQTIATTPIQANTDRLDVSVSIGIAEYRAGELPSQTIDRADGALYQAKHAGRNCIKLA